MTKHTPGPWEDNNGEVTTQRVDGRSFRRIAVVQDYGLGSLPEVDTANAKLIAAAPELLAALLKIREAFYVDGTRKALMSAFEGTKELVVKSRGF